VPGEAGEQPVEVGVGEFPVERGGRGVVLVLFEGLHLGSEGVQAGEVVWGEELALDDGEVHLD